MKKTVVLDLSTGSGIRDLEALKNKCGVRILNEKEYFGLSGGEDGVTTVLMRCVDYEEHEPNALIDSAVYQMPLC